MWYIPKWYVSACSNSVQYVRLQFWCCRCCTWWWWSRRRSVKVCRSVPATVKTPKDIPLFVIMQRYRTMRTTSRKVVVIIRIIFSSSNNIDVISTPIGFVFAKKWHIILLSIHQPAFFIKMGFRLWSSCHLIDNSQYCRVFIHLMDIVLLSAKTTCLYNQAEELGRSCKDITRLSFLSFKKLGIVKVSAAVEMLKHHRNWHKATHIP